MICELRKCFITSTLMELLADIKEFEQVNRAVQAYQSWRTSTLVTVTNKIKNESVGEAVLTRCAMCRGDAEFRRPKRQPRVSETCSVWAAPTALCRM
jgi:hypothetical protein